MFENFAILVIGLGFLALPIMAFKVIYDDIKLVGNKISKRISKFYH